MKVGSPRSVTLSPSTPLLQHPHSRADPPRRQDRRSREVIGTARVIPSRDLLFWLHSESQLGIFFERIVHAPAACCVELVVRATLTRGAWLPAALANARSARLLAAAERRRAHRAASERAPLHRRVTVTEAAVTGAAAAGGLRMLQFYTEQKNALVIHATCARQGGRPCSRSEKTLAREKEKSAHAATRVSLWLT
jgi:hypothetical protein